MAARVDWYYQRASCEACKKSRALLKRRRVEVVETVDARRVRIGRQQALQLARGMASVVATRGRNIVEFDSTRDVPDDESLARALLGPTGNLKAPTIRVGRKLIVGFHAASFEAALK